MKIPFKFIQKALAVILFVLMGSAIKAEENKVLSTLQIFQDKKYPLNQRLFLHLNKTIYQDSDTIWFKGYSVQGPLQQSSALSQTIIVALLNADNEVVISKQFLNFKGIAEGQLELTSSIAPGNYLLVAYGSNMLNYDLRNVFRSPIEIRSSELNKYNFSFGFDQPFYRSKDPIEMQIHAFGKNHEPLSDLKLRYSILHGEEELDNGNIKANDEGKALLRFSNVSTDTAKQALTINVAGGNIDFPTEAKGYVPAFSRALDVQLLPEGGDLLSGLLQVVAFRSVDDLGRPIAISGNVLNKKGEVVAIVQTAHQGMGKFMMLPKEDEEYTLQITSPVTYEQNIKFPEVENKGFALSYHGNQKGKAVFKVAKNFEAIEKVTAIWQLDGLVLARQVFELEHEKVIAFNTQGLPTGIAKITLFDERSEPFAERLVFVRSNDNPMVEVTLNRTVFEPRSKVMVDLDLVVKDSLPIDADLSVLVTRIADGINPIFPIPNVHDYTYFKSELSGTVYQPRQYFENNENVAFQQYITDLVMLTHGWRKFDWYMDVCRRVEPGYEDLNYDYYRGQVTKGKSVVAKAKLDVCTIGSQIDIYEFEADENGRFYVKPEFIDKSSPTLIISTEKKNQFSRAKLSIDDSELEMRDSVVQLFQNELLPFVYKYNVGAFKKSVDNDSLFKLWDTKYIAELTVKAKKKRSDAEITLSRFSTGTMQALTEEDFGNTVSDIEFLLQGLRGGIYVEDDQVVKMEKGVMTPLAIVLNDIQIRDATFSDISWLSSDMIETIAYVKGPAVAYELDPGSGSIALMIWTKKAKNVAVMHREKKNKFTSNRYERVRKFYCPKYNTENLKLNPVPDKRTALHWDNNLKTDSLGKLSFEFYNGDLKGEYLINIQGVSEKNGPIFKEATFRVD